MNSKVVPILLGLILIGGVGGVVYFQKQQSEQSAQTQTLSDTGTTIPSTQSPNTTDTGAIQQPTNGDTTSTGDTPTPAASTFTSADVAKHNSAASCWTSIDNNVYDLTSWIPRHPGGQQAIKGLCGHDGSAAFHGQHDDAQKQKDILATMKIGVLSN